MCLALMMTTLILVGACDTSGHGQLQVQLTDNHLDDANVKNVFVTFSEVSVHTSSSSNDEDSGWIKTELKETQEIDLLTLQNDVNKLLAEQKQLPAGTYQQFRVIVASARVVMKDGSEATVKIPSNKLRANLGVTIEANKTYGVVLDFDAEKSLKQTGGGWLMSPPVISVKDIYVVEADGKHTSIKK
jgi:hypothetical protein